MITGLNDIELDLPPEYCQYRDEGCELSQSCLKCPLPQCVHDVPGGRGQVRRDNRNEDVLELYRRGRTVPQLARQFHVSERTVYRILKRNKGK